MLDLNRFLWIVWTFVIGVMPGFFAGDWFYGPVIPGPTEVSSAVLPLVVLLLCEVTSRAGVEKALRGNVARVVVCLGAVATAASIVIKIDTYAGNSLLYEEPLDFLRLRNTLALPCEMLSVTGWSLHTMRVSSGEKPAPMQRPPLLYLAGAVWPCMALLIGLLPGPGSLGFWDLWQPSVRGVLVCLLSGAALCLLFHRMGASLRLVDMAAFQCGIITFRASAAIASRILDGLFLSDLNAEGCVLAGVVSLGAFVLVVSASFVSLVVCAKRRRAVKEAPEEEQEQAAPECALSRLPGYDSLTEREQSVLQATLDGMTGKETADRLGISASSVGTYRRRGYEKLGVQSKAELEERVGECGESFSANAREKDITRENASPGGLSAAGRVICALCTALLMFLAPSNYISLSFEPWGLDLGATAQYAMGIVLIAAGLACGLRAVGGGVRACIENPGTVRLLGLVALSAGMIVGKAWGVPIPASLYLASVIEFLSMKLLSMVSLVALIVGSGIWSAGATGKVRCSRGRWTALLGQGMSELVFARPIRLALFGAGMLLCNLVDGFYIPDPGMSDIFDRTCFWAPVLVVLLEVVMVVLTARGGDEGTLEGADTEALLVRKGLSPMQAQVVVMSLDGMSSEQIGRELHIAPSTVRSHRSRACKTLGVDGIDDLRSLL